jgi:hypothetical protein
MSTTPAHTVPALSTPFVRSSHRRRCTVCVLQVNNAGFQQIVVPMAQRGFLSAMVATHGSHSARTLHCMRSLVSLWRVPLCGVPLHSNRVRFSLARVPLRAVLLNKYGSTDRLDAGRLVPSRLRWPRLLRSKAVHIHGSHMGTHSTLHQCMLLTVPCAPRVYCRFGYDGPSDTSSTSALATLCRRPNADCTAGIALWGNSFGGLTLGNAPRFAPVTAMVHGPQSARTLFCIRARCSLWRVCHCVWYRQ